MAITTVAEYKAYANITGTDMDAQLAVLLGIAQARIRQMAGRNPTDGFDATVTRTEIIDGTGQEKIQVAEWPIVAITSVSILDDTGTPTVLASSDYVVDSPTGLIARNRYPVTGRFAGASRQGATWLAGGCYEPETWGTYPCWPAGIQNIGVMYRGGYATIPDSLKAAVWSMMDLLRTNAGQSTGFQSETISGDYSYTRGSMKDATETIREQLRMDGYIRGSA